MTRAALRIGAIKEFRALMPVWLASLAAMIVGAAVTDPLVRSLDVMAYVLGAITLGSLSIGHEYGHRTLPQLLSLPVGRGPVLLQKLGVVTVLLLTLAGVAGSGAPPDAWMIVGLPILAALFIAPFLTMVCRGTLPGVVFTMVVVGSMWTAAELLTLAIGGAQRFTRNVFFWEVATACLVSAAAGWRTFMRLEAIEGRGAEIHLPQWLAGGSDAADTGTAVRRHPYWLLVYKELRLQQLSLVIAALLIVEWTTVTILRGAVAGFSGPPFGIVTVLYSWILSVLIGSLASAEERHLGTLEWQLLLPVAAWKQWTVKVATTLGLVLALAVGLPALLLSIRPAVGDIRLNEFFAGIVIVLTVVSLYVSSISASGIRALLFAIAVVAGGVLTINRLVLSLPFRNFQGRFSLSLVLLAGFLAVLLRLALANHRSADVGARRVSIQVMFLSGCLALCTAVFYMW
jgi:hypothetical protein